MRKTLYILKSYSIYNVHRVSLHFKILVTSDVTEFGQCKKNRVKFIKKGYLKNFFKKLAIYIKL